MEEKVVPTEVWFGDTDITQDSTEYSYMATKIDFSPN